MGKKRATLSGNVSTAVPGEIRLLLRKLSSLTGSAASAGWWTSEEMSKFVELVEPILYEIGGPNEEANDEEPISPTPESEAGCAEFQPMWGTVVPEQDE